MYSLEEWIRYGDELRRPLLVANKLSDSSHVVIVGGGLSGLTIAYRLGLKRPDVKLTILEGSDELGGVIKTWNDGEWICDIAVNATRSHPAVWRLADDLSLGDVFMPSNPNAQHRWVHLKGQPHRLSWRTAFKIGPLRLRRSLVKSRKGGRAVSEVLPHEPIANAMTLGIVNETAAHVDADFLFPSLTRFGPNPPIKWSAIKKKMRDTYPLFTPKKGSLASFEGGMESLVKALSNVLKGMPNVSVEFGTSANSPESVAEQYDVPLSAVVWTIPKNLEQPSTSLSIFIIGYRKEDISNIPIGYGTLIPDSKIPISGILNESDIHHSSRAPKGHRLFRLMVPHSRLKDDHQRVKECAHELLGSSESVVFHHLGDRKIPSYLPGHMDRISQHDGTYTRAGWAFSGVSITHVIAEAERIAALF